jgi:pimeloyl-ACP methyl ester carboxylesterase
MRLPEGLDDIEQYVDAIEGRISGLEDVVLVGDSFGAVIAIGVAVRQRKNLRGLVLSGGFAANPVTSPLLKARIQASRVMPGALYEAVTLRFHAASLASPFDLEGQVPWPKSKSRDLFAENTPHASYVARARAAFSADYVDLLAKIQVPTLILTPEYDKLIGPEAARLMVDHIPDAREVVIPRTGHMFRFSHPETYAREVARFVNERVHEPESLSDVRGVAV